MSPNPDSFLQHLRREGYHPRSNKHSDSIAEAIVHDLKRHCPNISRAFSTGWLVYQLNSNLIAGRAVWNVDLVIGPPGLDTGTLKPEKRTPSNIEIAIEFKSVMTEHRKAVKNRKRDLEAHHDHVHRYNNLTIAGGLFVINGSAKFKSPLREDITVHREPRRLIEHCIQELRSVTSRGSTDTVGLDAKAAVVVNVDNLNRSQTRFLTTPPAPQLGDPLHYDAFILTICQLYTQRFEPRD